MNLPARVIACVLTLLVSTGAGAQRACDYFHLLAKTTSDGRTYGSPEFTERPGDPVAAFLKEHRQRFTYLLFNRIDSITKIARLHPDTAAVRATFCAAINRLQGVADYFPALIPGAGERKDLPVFSTEELMAVASRFYYCELGDAGKLTTHVCVGIHGQKEGQQAKDYTLLEAFCIEGIFAMSDEEEKGVDEALAQAKSQALQKANGVTQPKPEKEQLLRTEVYSVMSKSADLKKALLAHYERNRDNLGFRLSI